MAYIPEVQKDQTPLALLRGKKSRAWVAAQVGVSEAQVSRWESGERGISLEKAEALGKLYGKTREEIMRLVKGHPDELDGRESPLLFDHDEVLGRIDALERNQDKVSRALLRVAEQLKLPKRRLDDLKLSLGEH